MIRPTPKAVALFGASVPAAVPVILLRPEAWYVSFLLPFAVLFLLLVDAAMALPNRRLKQSLTAPPRLCVGESGNFALRLECPRYKRNTKIRALLEISGSTKETPESSGIMQDEKLELLLAVTPERRGRLSVDAVWLTWRGPMGLVEQYRREKSDVALDVVPDIRGIRQAAIAFFSNSALHGLKTQRRQGEGTEYENLCEYARGMDSRFIDWKHSARHGRLLCKEFRQERNHHIVTAFDTGHLMTEQIDGISRLDHAIRSALLLCWISLRSGDLVGGCSFDARFESYLKPERGMTCFTQFQRFAASLDYGEVETNFTLGLAELYGRLQRRSLVVIFTEFVDSIAADLMLESLALMTRRHLVVFVTMRDPLLDSLRAEAPRDFESAAQAVVADDLARDRRVVLERIARMGVHCLDVTAKGLSTALLNRYIAIKQRGLL